MRASYLVGIFLAITPLSGSSGESVFFENTVAPILEKHCAKCHNPEKIKGELNLTSVPGILKGGEQGPVFAAGSPEKSHLYELVSRGEMPKEGEKLSPEQIETIRVWIAGGALFENPPLV
ncbi:MAG: hypothetical protein KBF76_19805 [Verrucomicrobiales bacterium]|nr:hypothetical protein [Verrucomicrobiales bacterium]